MKGNLLLLVRFLLTHDREILTPLDDSIYQVTEFKVNDEKLYLSLIEKRKEIDKQVHELNMILEELNNDILNSFPTELKELIGLPPDGYFNTKFEEIKTSCSCNHKTIVNARMNKNKEIITDGEQIDVGGNEKYISVCRKCYFSKTGHYLYKEIKNNLD